MGSFLNFQFSIVDFQLEEREGAFLFNWKLEIGNWKLEIVKKYWLVSDGVYCAGGFQCLFKCPLAFAVDDFLERDHDRRIEVRSG